MAYATTVELGAKLGYTPSNAQTLLDRASDDVDRAIQCAVYEVDAGTGLPASTTVADALKKAVLEQVAYQLEIGNKNGIAHGLQAGVPSGTSAGEVTVSRGPSTGGATADMPWLGGNAAWALRKAGLLGQAPQTGQWYP